MLAVNGVLYAGGNFTETANGVVKGLGGLACWKYGSSSKARESLSASGSTVGSLIRVFQLVGESLYILGRLTDVGGQALGVFNTRNLTWATSDAGVCFGQLTAANTNCKADARTVNFQ
ncbi:hypothetical protein PCANC_08090 [Puccinia coronata f. sp. avenae]|uniref:Uncharacterized protein n=1 Tax=Puccinia coronata f. sp. avenae TaxID=200324 RepID=A0A2N5V3F7_9BASI|nr:hypothetical protein PCANC_08090 [Puccinia coronata f. sp. avenae]